MATPATTSTAPPATATVPASTPATPPPSSAAPGSLTGSFPGSGGPQPGLLPFAAQYKEGVTELTAIEPEQDDSSSVPCEGRAVVISKSSLVAANGACPTTWTNISCSCVANGGTNSSSEWVFNVKKKDKTPSSVASPTTLDPASAVLEVSTIGQFALPDRVTTLRVLSTTTDKSTDFDLDLISPYNRDNKMVSLIETETQNYIKEVELSGIDLSNVDIAEGFLPPSVTKLTLRNCNLQTPPASYLNVRWEKLLSIDFTGNSLSTWYGGDMTAAPPNSGCTVTSLNLSGNKFKTVPSAILGMPALQTFNLSSNPITNLTLSEALYTKIVGLESFSLDGVDASSLASTAACGNYSAVRTAHNVSFCVATTSQASNSTSSSTTDTDTGSSTNTTLMIAGVCGGLLIVALATALFLMHRKRRKESRGKGFSRTHDEATYASHPRGFDSLPAAFSSRTLSLDDGSGAGLGSCNPTLLSDPMIITSRLDHKDLLFGELLKQGGFGMVFSGVYKRRRVAIKKIRSEFSMDAKLVDSFLKEIALMASLSHPRIVEYIGCAWDHVRNLSMVTELMTRGDLREVLQHYKHQRKTPLTWASHKTRMALHIAEGLRYLHTLSPKVIHRDLKSKNVLVSDELEAKLTDFGISREGRFEQTHMTAGIGTSFWIAPEVLAGLRYDERADIFSFGVVLSEIDTDDYPYWNARSEQEGPADGGQERGQTQEVGILRMVLSGEMRPQFTSECPQAIRFLADRCLEGEPSKRPSANEIVEYLMAVTSGPGSES